MNNKMNNIKTDDIELVYRKNNDKIIYLKQSTFMDLLEELEKVSVDFVDLSELNNYIFMAYSNEYNYIIHNIINNNETYIFQYKKINRQNNNEEDKEKGKEKDKEKDKENNITFENIPNAIFRPDEIYDFEVNITQKKFKKLNQYTVINMAEVMHTINMQMQNNKNKNSNGKKKGILHKFFGC